tara:strand:+ start:1504 stop:2112 length:609 start_codon:yes stop_codon:yes gene_type:complete
MDKKTNLKELYDNLYDNGYHDIKENMTHSRNLIKIINDIIPKNKKILDVGCSHGYAVEHLKNMGYDSYGVDIADKAIEYCIKRGLTNCKCSNANNINFKDNMFDVILSTDTLEHIPINDVDKVIEEFNRVTKKEATIFIKVATVPEINRSWEHIINDYVYSDLHLTTENLKFWRNNFENKYFKTVDIIFNTNNFFEIILTKK